MTRADDIRSLAAREQIGAVLRDAPTPMTAREIGQLVGFAFSYPCDTSANPCLEEQRLLRMVHAEHLNGRDAVFFSSTQGGSITPHLERMAKAGKVARSKVGRSVVWTWVGPAGVSVAELEAVLG